MRARPLSTCSLAAEIQQAAVKVRGISFAEAPLTTDPAPDLGFLFRVYQGPGSLGWSADEMGGEDFTVLNVHLDITPVRMPLYSDWDTR